MATANGTVKKTAATQFSRQRSVGLRAIELEEDDVLVGTAITDGNSDIMLFSTEGKATRFNEGQVRAMGRTAEVSGVSTLLPVTNLSRSLCQKRAVVF